MSTLLLIIAGVWTLAYFGAPLVLWAAATAGCLVVLQLFGIIVWSALLLWPLAIALFVPFLIPDLRNKLFTVRIFSIFRRVLPPMSDTEREAIEAGNTWWEAKLFQGKPHWKDWLHIERPTLSSEEQAFMNDQVATLCSMSDEERIVEELQDLPEEVWAYLKKERFFGMIIPKKYGGLGFSALAHSEIITKICSVSGSLAVTTMVPNSLGPAELLLKYGTEKQKEYYLPRLAQGEDIPCFGLTSPEAGSDAGAIQDTGVVCKGKYAGKDVLGIRLNWDKRYITLAPIATVLGLAFKLYDPDHLLGDETSLGITLCLIPTRTPGVSIGSRHFPIGMAFMNGPTRGKDVFVPIDWIIGGREMAGQGWRMLMECLSAGRGISLPALSTSSAMIAYRTTGAYARLREQFKLPIGYFEGVQDKLARIGGNMYTIEATRQVTASAVDMGEKPSVVSAIAKYHMTELARESVIDGMDVHAGKTVIMGPKNYLGRIYQVQPIGITVEGANILTRSLMIFGQGAIRCHPYVRDEVQAATLYETDQIEATKLFDEAIWGHFRYFFSNFAKSLWMGLTGAWLVLPPKRDKMFRYFQKLSWLSAGLAFSSDVAMMILGGKLKKAEQLSARLGDMLSQLYLAACILKYCDEHGCDDYHKTHAQWALKNAMHKSQVAFYEFCQNFPIRPVGWVMRFIVAPFGLHCDAPSDTLDSKVAHQMMSDSEFRNLLTHLVDRGNQDNGYMAVERAFEAWHDVKPLLDSIQQGVKEGQIHKTLSFEEKAKKALELSLIDEKEHAQLNRFKTLRDEVIAVDEFEKQSAKESNNPWNTQKIVPKTNQSTS